MRATIWLWFTRSRARWIRPSRSIERLLRTPGATTRTRFYDGGITQAELRLRWQWDKLRGDPRFQKIARRTGAENGLLEPSYKSSRCSGGLRPSIEWRSKVRRCLRLRSHLRSPRRPSAWQAGQPASAVTKETCCLSGSLLNHGKFSERSLSSSDHSSGVPDGA